MGAVRCDTRISPAICGHIATRPYTRQSRNPTSQSEAAMHARPSMCFSRSVSTFIGPGDGAAPGAGCGNAVDIAVWNVTFPSTFCIT